MATGAVDPDGLAALDHADLAARCAEAEAEVARLRAELADARAALSQQDAPATGFALFDHDDFPGASNPGDRILGDGSDPRVLSVILTATAVVTGMVAVLALLNGTLLSPFGIVIIALTLLLAWGAVRTRVVPIEVSVTRGIVYIDQGDTSHRFDIRKGPATVEMVGRPGDPGWQLRFTRRGLDPFVVDGTMVDAETFVEQLREWRPEL